MQTQRRPHSPGRCTTFPDIITTTAMWLLVSLGVVGLLYQTVVHIVPLLIAAVAPDRALAPRLPGSLCRKRLRLDPGHRGRPPLAPPLLHREQLGAHIGEIALLFLVLRDGLDHSISA